MEPTARRLATRKARQKRAYRRALYRFVARSGLGSLHRWQVRLLEDGQPTAMYSGNPRRTYPITLRRTK
jgi:hypothetical protein